MCWHASYCPIKKVATEPIKVYKWLKPGLISPYTKYEYKLDSLNKHIELHYDSHQYWEIFSLHIYKSYIVNEGYHSYKSLNIAINHHFPRNTILYECEIPTGTEYYDEDIQGEIVSSNIIIRKAI